MSAVSGPLQPHHFEQDQKTDRELNPVDEQRLLERLQREAENRPESVSTHDQLGVEYLNHMMVFKCETKIYQGIMAQKKSDPSLVDYFGNFTIDGTEHS